MSKSVALTAAVAAILLMAGWTAPAESAVTKAQLDKAIDQLTANGKIWAEDENIPSNDKVDLKNLKFDKESASVISAALRTMKRDLPGLYATARLMERLAQCDEETIKAIFRDVNMVHLRTRSLYRPFPTMSKAQIDSLKMPEYSDRLSTDAIMERMGSLDERREAKLRKDVPIAKQNEAAWDIEKAFCKMMAECGSSSDDNMAVRTMLLAEHNGDATFLVILDAYQAACKKMDPARAARLYSMLRPYALRMRTTQKKNYNVKGEALLHADAPSQMGTEQGQPGVRIAQLVNALSDAAKDKSRPRIPLPVDPPKPAKKK